MDSVIVNHVVDIVAALVQAVLLGLIAYGFAKITPKIKDDRIKTALGVLQGAVNTTVGELNQLAVKEWKSSNGGKLTPEQIERLKKQSVELVYEKLTDSTIKLLDSAYSNVDSLIQSFVQARIDELKNQPSSPPSPGM